MASSGLRIAVLIKQIPRFEEMELTAEGRLKREGVELEMSAYCRRAVSKGVELARELGGTCTVFTLGPPSAEDSLREAIAWGADTGVLITDPAFAGSDSLATARALVAALRREGPYDLILAGRNSVDADTGQVAPEVAELLDLPFLGGVRHLTVAGSTVTATCEHDDARLTAETSLPAVVSCAERLIEPAKVDPDGRQAVDARRLRALTTADLGPGPWGQAGSPTSVGRVRKLAVARWGEVLSGSAEAQVRKAVDLLVDRGGLVHQEPSSIPSAAVPGRIASEHATPRVIAVLVEPARPRIARELLGAAAVLAEPAHGHVVAIGAPDDLADGDALSSWGADALVVLDGSRVEEDIAAAVVSWSEPIDAWAVLAPGTMWGREVSSRIAARLGAGLTGDAVELSLENDRLVGWKPAFGGSIVAAITASSPVQMATVRAGVLPLLAPRGVVALPPATVLPVEDRGRVRHIAYERDDDMDELMRAGAVVGVGTGVAPEQYPLLMPLLSALSAELAATRKVTDNGWQPRARQVGITGRTIAPRLYVAIGLSGKFNHLVGVRAAGVIVAINRDATAPVFQSCDIGIVGDWHDVVPLLVAEIERARH